MFLKMLNALFGLGGLVLRNMVR